MRGKIIQQAGGDYYAGRVFRIGLLRRQETEDSQYSVTEGSQYSAPRQQSHGSQNQDNTEYGTPPAVLKALQAGCAAGMVFLPAAERLRDQRIIHPGFQESAVFIQKTDPGTHVGFPAGPDIRLGHLFKHDGLMERGGPRL